MFNLFNTLHAIEKKEREEKSNAKYLLKQKKKQEHVMGNNNSPNKRNARRAAARLRKKQVLSALKQQKEEKHKEMVSEVVQHDLNNADEPSISILSKTPVKVSTTVSSGSNQARFDFFQDFSSDVLVSGVLPYLNAVELAMFAQTSTHHHTVCDSGQLWREMFSREYPQSQFIPTSLKDWQTAFYMEKHNAITSQYVCFQNGSNFTTGVLGLPLAYTVNPLKKSVDFIRPSLYLLSQEAFERDWVRQAPDGENFQLLLPLYFSPGLSPFFLSLSLSLSLFL